ncbi:MAG: flotillin-like FloA family protein, partial [Planctomycetes bacterium]|nr:flotillin-like FloA family protein [Planctomycetota bacterium]
MDASLGLILAQMPKSGGWTIVWVVLGLVLLVAIVVIMQFFRLWLQAFMSNADVSMAELIGMRLRKVDAATIVLAKIQLVKAGIHGISTNDLESHYLAGGRVPNVSRAMIAANRAVLDLDWKKSCAIDLAGRDIIDAVRTSVDPKVIDVPHPEAPGRKRTIAAGSTDGI